jgi:hypothetical protein
MAIAAKNTVSREYTGNQTFEQNTNRNYLLITMTVGTGTVALGTPAAGDTVGELPLPLVGSYYEPYVCPTGKIVVTTTGTFVMVTG